QIGLGSVQKYHQRALVGLRKGRSVAFRRLSMNHPPTALVRFYIGRFFRTTFRSKIILPTKILHLILISPQQLSSLNLDTTAALESPAQQLVLVSSHFLVQIDSVFGKNRMGELRLRLFDLRRTINDVWRKV